MIKLILRIGPMLGLLQVLAPPILANGEIEDLANEIRRLNPKAMKLAAEQGKTNLIPLLEEAVNAPVRPSEPGRTWARRALAKLGVRRYYDEIIRDAICPKNNPEYAAWYQGEAGLTHDSVAAERRASNFIREQALGDIIYLREPAAVKHVARLAFEPSPAGPHCEPMWQQGAIYVLSMLNLPTSPEPRGQPHLYARSAMIEEWQRWWEQYKDYYEKLEFGQSPSPMPGPERASSPVAVPLSSQTPPMTTPASHPSPMPALSSRDWLWLGGIGIVLLAAIVGTILVRRRR